MDTKQMLTPKDVERTFRISPGTLATWRCYGRGPCFVKLGRRVFYRRSDVETWVEDQAGTASGLTKVFIRLTEDAHLLDAQLLSSGERHEAVLSKWLEKQAAR